MTTDIKQTSGVLGEILGERLGQERKWGPRHHSDLEWLTILVEEVGEAGKACCELWISGSDRAGIRRELIHVAAVAVAWAEDMGREPK